MAPRSSPAGLPAESNRWKFAGKRVFAASIVRKEKWIHEFSECKNTVITAPVNVTRLYATGERDSPRTCHPRNASEPRVCFSDPYTRLEPAAGCVFAVCPRIDVNNYSVTAVRAKQNKTDKHLWGREAKWRRGNKKIIICV